MDNYLNPTKEKILDVAEALFADFGFSETSLRMITTKAGVNLASVNYHFGSKKILIQAVLERFMGAFTRDLNLEIDQLELKSKNNHIEVIDVLNTLIKPITELNQLRPDLRN